MFKLISCVILCLSFPVASNAAGDFREALDGDDVSIVEAMLAEDPALLEKPISVHESIQKRPLLYAVDAKNYPMVRALLAAGADPDVVSPNGWKPLTSVAQGNDLEGLRVLLDGGATKEKTSSNQTYESPLEIAAREGHLEIVKELIDRGLSVDDGHALSVAVGYKHWSVARFLLNRGADPNRGYAFTTAAERAPLAIVELMLEHGADPNAKFYYGGALERATGDLEKVKLLVAAGAKINGLLEDGDRPLHTAASKGNVAVVVFLLEQNAEVNVHKADRQTPLDSAIRNGHAEVVKLLLDAGAERTLHAEVALGDVAQVEAALDHGADVNQAVAGDYAPQLIHTAIKFEQPEMLELLLEKGADVDATIGDVSALHQAVGQRSIALVKVLLDAGADANPVLFEHGYGMQDLTPLHFIASEKYPYFGKSDSASPDVELAIAKLLLDNGADPTLEFEVGLTALRLAESEGKTHLVELLKNYE